MAITLKAVIGTTLGLIFMAYIFPEAITAIEAVNTSAWTFTGHAGAAALWGLLILVAMGAFISIVAGGK